MCFGLSVTAAPLHGLAVPAVHMPLPQAGTFVGLLSVLGIDESVQNVVLISKGEQDPHDLLGVGVDVQQGLHQAGLPCV